MFNKKSHCHFVTIICKKYNFSDILLDLLQKDAAFNCKALNHFIKQLLLQRMPNQKISMNNDAIPNNSTLETNTEIQKVINFAF